MAEIRLKTGEVAHIDDEDVAECRRWAWSRKVKYGTTYLIGELRPVGRRPRVRIPLHRLVMKAEPGINIDHVDGNGLNCRKSNLRFATNMENQWNRVTFHASEKYPYRGVMLREDGRFDVKARHDGVMTFLGTYDNPEYSACIYDSYIIPRRGEFARPNFEYPLGHANFSPSEVRHYVWRGRKNDGEGLGKLHGELVEEVRRHRDRMEVLDRRIRALGGDPASLLDKEDLS